MTFFFFLSKTHLAGLWQIRQVHLLESKGCTFSVTRMHITFGYLANLKKKKKEVKMPSDQVSSQLNVR